MKQFRKGDTETSRRRLITYMENEVKEQRQTTEEKQMADAMQAASSQLEDAPSQSPDAEAAPAESAHASVSGAIMTFVAQRRK